jgi:agmatine deiminase
VTNVSYLNHYLANNAVIVGVSTSQSNDEALAQLAAIYKGRTIVEVPGEVIAQGGGGPHCITQQVPAGNLKGL